MHVILERVYKSQQKDSKLKQDNKTLHYQSAIMVVQWSMQPPCISFQIHRAYQLRAYIRVLKLPPLRLHALRLNLNF